MTRKRGRNENASYNGTALAIPITAQAATRIELIVIVWSNPVTNPADSGLFSFKNNVVLLALADILGRPGSPIHNSELFADVLGAGRHAPTSYVWPMRLIKLAAFNSVVTSYSG
jgi:hypothetical protein